MLLANMFHNDVLEVASAAKGYIGQQEYDLAKSVWDHPLAYRLVKYI